MKNVETRLYDEIKTYQTHLKSPTMGCLWVGLGGARLGWAGLLAGLTCIVFFLFFFFSGGILALPRELLEPAWTL